MPQVKLMNRFHSFFKTNWKPAIVYFLISAIGILLFYLNTKLLGGQVITTTKLSLCAYCIAIPLILTFLRSKEYALTKRESVLSILLSIIISQFISFGSYANAINFVTIVFSSAATIIIWLLQSAIYTYIAYYFIGHIVYELQNHQMRQDEKKVNLQKIFWALLAVNTALIFVVYPCVFDFDGAIGLRTYLNPDDVKSNHHPYLIQMIHGFFWNFGKTIGNPSIGMAVLTFCYCVVTSAILTYGVAVLNKYGVGRKHLIFILILLPFYISLSHLPTKDGFFAYAFLCYTITILEIIFSKKDCLRSAIFLIVHSISIVFVCLSRNQGIYIVLVESAILLIYCYRSIHRLSVSIIPAFVTVILFVKVFLPSQNVVPSGRAEMFGTLFQQTALYTIRHSDDITTDEADAINAILPIEKIKKAYKPSITDYVKGCYCQIGQPGVIGTMRPYSDSLMHFSDKQVINESTKLKKYFTAWFFMFQRHPMTYFDAAFAVDYGFFYNKGEMLYFLACDWPNSRATTPEYAFCQNKRVHQFFNALYGYAVHVPILNWLASIPYYIWLFIILVSLLLFRKDWKSLVLLMPSLLSFCVLLVCPVCNARYMYPILVCLPLYIFYTLLTNKKSISNG